MKLRNKILLPIFAVGTTAAVATPLLTSCGKIGWDDYYVEIPTIGKAIPSNPESVYEEHQINKIYINHIVSNPEILVQDLRFFHSYNVYSFVKNYMTREFYFPNIDFNVHMSNLKVEPYQANGILYMTFDLNGSVTIKLPSGAFTMYIPGGEDEDVDYISFYEIELTNFKSHWEHVPFTGFIDTVYFPGRYDGYNYFGFAIANYWLEEDSTWYVEASAKGNIIGDNAAAISTYNNEVFRYDYEYSPGTPWHDRIARTRMQSLLVSLMNVQYSYHMSDYGIEGRY